MDQEIESYNVPLDHPHYEDAKTTETNDVLINKILLYPDKKNYLCTLCPKKVVNLNVFINHRIIYGTLEL